MDDYYSIDPDKFLEDDNDAVMMVRGDDDVMLVGDGRVVLDDEEMPDELKDFIVTTRSLIVSCSGQELLMVRHEKQSPRAPFHRPAYTRKVDIFKADMNAGQWVPITASALAQGEALFLSRSSSRVTHAYGDIKEGFVYVADMDDAFDTRSGARSPVTLPWQIQLADGKLLRWFFPPQLML